MVAIESMLPRIRRDPEFGRCAFTLGHFDRIARRIETVPMQPVHLEGGDHFSLTAIGADGSAHDVPLQRVRELRCAGVRIWQREVPADAGS